MIRNHSSLISYQLLLMISFSKNSELKLKITTNNFKNSVIFKLLIVENNDADVAVIMKKYEKNFDMKLSEI